MPGAALLFSFPHHTLKEGGFPVEKRKILRCRCLPEGGKRPGDLAHPAQERWPLGLPQGPCGEKETEEETALREIKEETGLKVALDTAFRKMVTYSPKPGVMKDVIYFAAKAKKDSARPQPEEVLELCWKSPEEALEAVTYDTDRQVLQAFLEYHKKASEK